MCSKFRGVYPFPNFCLGADRSQIRAHDTDWPKESPIKFWGKSPQGNMSYEFPIRTKFLRLNGLKSYGSSWIFIALRKAIKGASFRPSIVSWDPAAEEWIPLHRIAWKSKISIISRPVLQLLSGASPTSRPSPATGLGPGQHRHSTINSFLRLPLTLLTAVAYTLPH